MPGRAGIIGVLFLGRIEVEKYSRAQPSSRYLRLVGLYQRMHKEGETRLGISPDETFPGKSLPPQAGHVKRLIDATGSRTVLDYGSGKGQQYRPLPVQDEQGNAHLGIAAWWEVEVRCYDPGYAPYSELPKEKFDGVVCTDVLEHCPEEDMPWIVGELFSYASKFVFANVACFPARKHLPNGQNAHCTVKSLKWWRPIVETAASKAASRAPGILYEFRFAMPESAPAGTAIIEKTLTNSRGGQR